MLQATNTNDNQDHYHSLRRVVYSLGDEMYQWRFVLFCFARVELAARDVAIHDIMVAMVKKPMPPEVAGSAARRW